MHTPNNLNHLRLPVNISIVNSQELCQQLREEDGLGGMHCVVYKSERQADTYLYLADHCDFQDLSGELQQIFGEPVRVMRLELSEKSRLARVDATVVIQELEKNGYFLQLPPKYSTEEEISKRFS